MRARRAEEVWGEAEVDPLAELQAAFLHTKRRESDPGRLAPLMLLWSNIGQTAQEPDASSSSSSSSLPPPPTPPPRVHRSQTVLPPLLPTSFLHLSIPPRPSSNRNPGQTYGWLPSAPPSRITPFPHSSQVLSHTPPTRLMQMMSFDETIVIDKTYVII